MAYESVPAGHLTDVTDGGRDAGGRVFSGRANRVPSSKQMGGVPQNEKGAFKQVCHAFVSEPMLEKMFQELCNGQQILRIRVLQNENGCRKAREMKIKGNEIRKAAAKNREEFPHLFDLL
jgi:hypothetical protein